MVIRYCNGDDPNLVDGAGNRGNCGKTFDDRDRLTICPHGRFTKNLANALADGLGDGWLTMKISDARSYEFSVNRDMGDGRVFVLCQPCNLMHHDAANTVSWVPWAIVANVWELLAWIESHERERHAEIAGMVMPISPAGPDAATPIADSILIPHHHHGPAGPACTDQHDQPDATSPAPGWFRVPGVAHPAMAARARHPSSAVGIVPRQLVRGDQVDVEPDDLVQIGEVEGTPIMAPAADVADRWSEAAPGFTGCPADHGPADTCPECTDVQ